MLTVEFNGTLTATPTGGDPRESIATNGVTWIAGGVVAIGSVGVVLASCALAAENAVAAVGYEFRQSVCHFEKP
jgi:hypothetical protein